MSVRTFRHAAEVSGYKPRGKAVAERKVFLKATAFLRWPLSVTVNVGILSSVKQERGSAFRQSGGREPRPAESLGRCFLAEEGNENSENTGYFFMDIGK